MPFTVALGYVLTRTKPGLVIQAVGENAGVARAIGYNVTAIRYAAVAFGGAMAGWAGPMRPRYTPLWADGMIAGRGWIALALVVFGTWQTGRIALARCCSGCCRLAN